MNGDVVSDGVTLGDADGSGVASCDEHAASISPEATKETVKAPDVRIVGP